jgi:hypothetical protein
VPSARSYWIGGSPCAGKSTIAGLLAARHGLAHVECDAGAEARVVRMGGRTEMGTCERLSRPPEWQAAREIAFYRDQFPFLLAEFPADEPMLVEGADLLPELLQEIAVPAYRAVWVVPTPDFQVRHYESRPWVADYLKDCADPARAFQNWMRRDMLFAEHVRTQAAALGGEVLVVDGSRPVTETARQVEEHFRLNRT